MSASDVFKLIVTASPLELLALFIIAGALGQIVYGWVYKAMVKDRDDWKLIAQTAVGQNQQLLDLMESGKRGRSGSR